MIRALTRLGKKDGHRAKGEQNAAAWGCCATSGEGWILQ